MRGSRFRSRSPYLALALLGALCGACGGGGGSGGSDDGSDNDLVLVEFALVDLAGNPTGGTGTTNAYRNNRLEFTFSAPLDESTVNDRTIQIGIPSGTNLFLTTPGTFSVDGNRVYFDPTRTATGPRPFGLEPNSTYSVSVFGVPDPKTITSVEGKPVLSTFTTTFVTTDLYLPDLDQPRILSIYPAAQSDIPADRFSPEAQDIWVKSGDDVIVEFSEAMNPATFDQETSFVVINMDRNREVFGTFLFNDDATRVSLRPTFGFGRGPYLIRVSLTTDLTDLAGNAIANPQSWEFLTEFDETAINEGLVEEYFDDNSAEDTAFVPPGAQGIAAWNPATDPGKLASTFGTRTITMPCAPGGSSNWIPLGASSWVSCRFQCWYRPTELGNAGTISGLSFFAGSTFTQGAVLTNFIVKAGHTNTTLTPGTFDNNFTVGAPITMLNGVTYTMPSNMVYNSPAAFPPLEKSFGFNGTNNLVIDLGKASVTGNGSTWSCRSGFDSNVRRIWNTSQSSGSSNGSDTGYTYPWVVSFRTEDSMAQSLWFRTESQDPVYLDPIVAPTEQPAGTETMIEYQGAADDGNDNPDPGTYSSFVESPTVLEGSEYIRFRATFKANLGSGQGPKIEEIVIPYLFF